MESLEELRKQMLIMLANLEMALDRLRSREIFEALEFDEPDELKAEKDGIVYYTENPVRVLYLKIPEMPLSFNGGFLEKKYAEDRSVWRALRRWWIIKIKRALRGWYGALEPFSKCVVLGRFNFNAPGRWDLDNFATKFLLDALQDARVIAEDHAGNLPAHLWMAQKSETPSVELLVLEGGEGLRLFEELWQKYYNLCLQEGMAAPKNGGYGNAEAGIFQELGEFGSPIKIIPNKPGNP
ncbi:MAG: hypothetical protein QXP27_08005 [Candidatus Methanomethyliaceae archaeon]